MGRWVNSVIPSDGSRIYQKGSQAQRRTLTYYYRPQRSWGKVIFSVACVKNSVHGGVCPIACWDTHPRRGTLLPPTRPPREQTPRTRHPPPPTPRRYGQQAAVRILLECNLVWHNFCQKPLENENKIELVGGESLVHPPSPDRQMTPVGLSGVNMIATFKDLKSLGNLFGLFF